MAWFKVDDKFHSHRKAARAGEALCLWVLAGSWCMDHLTDGFIPDYIALRLVPNADQYAEKLVSARLWGAAEKDGDSGWQFHDWLSQQPSREQVLAERDAAKERQRQARERARERREASRRDISVTSGELLSDKGVSHGPPDPTRPDPTRPVLPTEVLTTSTATRARPAPRGNARGTRIPDDFAVTPEMRAWATAQGFGRLDLNAVTEEFFDYWRAIPGQRGVKLDWVATWRNRVRDAAGRAKITTPTRESSPWDRATQVQPRNMPTPPPSWEAPA